jgi:hypothetical protein
MIPSHENISQDPASHEQIHKIMFPQYSQANYLKKIFMLSRKNHLTLFFWLQPLTNTKLGVVEHQYLYQQFQLLENKPVSSATLMSGQIFTQRERKVTAYNGHW